MFVKTIVIGVNRFLGVVLIFIYTIGTVLVMVGIINAATFLTRTMLISCIGFPTMLCEKEYIREDLEKKKLPTNTDET